MNRTRFQFLGNQLRADEPRRFKLGGTPLAGEFEEIGPKAGIVGPTGREQVEPFVSDLLQAPERDGLERERGVVAQSQDNACEPGI